MKKYILILIPLLMILSSCGLEQGTIEKAPKSFLKFTGETKNSIVFIDDLEEFELNSSSNMIYEISPGKHRIKIKKSGKLILNRIVLLGNGIIKEIKVP